MHWSKLLIVGTLMCSTAHLSWSVEPRDVQDAFAQAFADNDATKKKAALSMAQSLPKEEDDLAYELLVKAVNDRQTHDLAVLALRARTGLEPTLLNRGSGYPGYPSSDDASEWNNWLAARKRDKEMQAKLKEQEEKLKKIEEEKNNPDAATADKGDKGDKPDAATGGDETSDEGDVATAPAYEPPSDLGRLDRVIFKSGGSLVCYILSKRVNADGVLQSVRVVHQNNGGEEILSADLIARIDEDIQ